MNFFIFFRSEQHKIFFRTFGFPDFQGNLFARSRLHIGGFTILLFGISAAADQSGNKTQ